MFAELFGRRGGGSGTGTARGTGVTYALSVDFLEAINGAKKRVIMADGKALDLTIPPGLNDGQTLRLRGQGPSGIGGAAAGDVLVVVHVKPHKDFRRDGNDIRSTLPVTLAQALGGAKLAVDTVAGPVNVTIPKGSNSGSVLRLRGKGVPAKGEPGNHFVELQLVLPTSPDDDFINSVVEWEKKQPYDPRKGTGAPS